MWQNNKRALHSKSALRDATSDGIECAAPTACHRRSANNDRYKPIDAVVRWLVRTYWLYPSFRMGGPLSFFCAAESLVDGSKCHIQAPTAIFGAAQFMTTYMLLGALTQRLVNTHTHCERKQAQQRAACRHVCHRNMIGNTARVRI